MGKKKSCQEVKVPRPLDAAETRLYGWIEEAVLTQPFVVESDSLLEFRRNFPLMEDSGAEGDYVLEAAGPSDRVPFRAGEEGPHFMWVYQELFTRLQMRLPFSDFQRDVMTRCRVAVSQLHLNGWGFILAFEKVCLHYGFRPTIRLFFYIYDVHFPPGGYRYISFRARQGRKLFHSYEDSIQEFKWHYFKVLAASGKCAFWLDHENRPFPWVYWNPEVKDFTVYNLEPLEMAAFKFLISLPSGLPKRNKFTCRFILDGSDAEVGKYLDDLLDVKMKRTKLDDLMARMADPSKMGPRAVLPTGVTVATAAVAAAASVAPAGPSINSAASSVQVPPPPPPAASKTKKSSSKREPPEKVDVEVEETAKEDPDANLRQKRRRKEKAKDDDIIDRALGDDAAWEHAVNPLDLAFPKKFNYRKALDAGLTSASVRKPLQGILPDQLLGESWRLQCQTLACQQLGLEAALKAKTKTEEEMLAAKDQLFVLKVERDSALEYLPLKEKAESLAQQLSQKEVEHKSALERVAQFDEDIKLLKAQLEFAQLSVSNDQKRAEAAESRVKSLTVSLETAQAELRKSREEADYWCTEWKSLGTEAQEMCQETLEVVLDQVSHLCPAVEFSAITLKTRWDLKGKRIYVPEELSGDGAEVAETLPEVDPEQQQQEQGNTAADVRGECPT
ncbi:hypothetical protein PIB30_021657 [Stylosanthes scabra]|uniref:Transposase (putative) gypsy type domain-containing protein n=1 Tax=Stylosanthes scabra TaxID=79078 RepID=A0ABU6Y957_9FABA|nr:hypothetical protein [Stylosanthes scabra]